MNIFIFIFFYGKLCCTLIKFSRKIKLPLIPHLFITIETRDIGILSIISNILSAYLIYLL